MSPLLTSHRPDLRILLAAGRAVAVAGYLVDAPSVRPRSLASASPPPATETPGGARPSPGVTAGASVSPTKTPANLGSTWSAFVDVLAPTAGTAREVQIIDIARRPEAVVAMGVLGEPERPGVWVSP
jgi:hypothetical protein